MDYDDDGEYRDIECYEDSNVQAVLCQSNAGGIIYMNYNTIIARIYFTQLSLK